MKRILVIAPHPDDEVLGCGGTIRKYADLGYELYLCIVTKAYEPDWTKSFLENRKKEIEKANKILKIKKLFPLNFPAVKLDTVSQKQLNDTIYEVVKQVEPEIVFIPFAGDLNKDHRLVYESSLVATRPHLNLSINMLVCYEVLSETEWGMITFNPNYYEDISSTIKSKIKAMDAYKSELKQFPHPRSLKAIKSLAEKRGSEIGFKYAEAFEIVRMKKYE